MDCRPCEVVTDGLEQLVIPLPGDGRVANVLGVGGGGGGGALLPEPPQADNRKAVMKTVSILFDALNRAVDDRRNASRP